ncbi:hypothetical protein P691DRAFT_801819 [Macrolepiota fuliginosa MF-IS2]|uniref:Uncharacterized protein n=1 Tax=Macrolepiota fuliginosa MF-IS2 TaxID=1400762 RepID=A0A9P6C3I4_9AGAR|nr:hypothetical protein P691DRAFT_801819 [Macrolepiota fuliginosa MF-IS2]
MNSRPRKIDEEYARLPPEEEIQRGSEKIFSKEDINVNLASGRLYLIFQVLVQFGKDTRHIGLSELWGLLEGYDQEDLRNMCQGCVERQDIRDILLIEDLVYSQGPARLRHTHECRWYVISIIAV